MNVKHVKTDNVATVLVNRVLARIATAKNKSTLDFSILELIRATEIYRFINCTLIVLQKKAAWKQKKYGRNFPILY